MTREFFRVATRHEARVTVSGTRALVDAIAARLAAALIS
jgi:hypothetical protein